MHQLSLVIENPPETAGSSPADVPAPLIDAHGQQILNITASIERVVYYNDETGQCVLDVKPFDFKPHVLISANLASVFPGQNVEAQVIFSQFQLQSFKSEDSSAVEGILTSRKVQLRPPSSARTLKKYLKSGSIAGLGPHLATTLAKAFPETFLSVLDENPRLLLEVPGVGRKRQLQILEAWKQSKALTQFRNFLFSEGLPLTWAQILWPSHGIESHSFLKEHPYEAVTRHQLAFDEVDAFALREGFSLSFKPRIRCGLYDVLQSYYKQGHCAYPEAKLIEETREKLAVSNPEIEDALELELISENLISDSISGVTCIYLKEIWDLEQAVARKLLAFDGKQPPWGWFNSQKVLNWAQTLLNIQLAPLQKQAIETALSSSLTVITGGPGTGKTTLIRSLVTILQTQFMKFALCSPTGRAAQRLDEATGAPAKTIHRLLKYDSSSGKFIYNQSNPLDLDLVLIDEVSMVDLSLMSHLLDALPSHCALILVGDADQIPPVGAGNILQSVIDSSRFQTVKLTDIFRQSEKSLIKLNAHRINSGEMPINAESGPSDFHYLPTVGIEETKKVILDLVTRVIPNECSIRDPSQLQILVPLNRGPLGTKQLNEELQQLISQPQPMRATGQTAETENSESVSGFGQTFKRGDKVMVIKNDYKKDVFNGDIGFIHRIDHFQQFIEVQFEERSVFFNFEELDRLTLAYAISIHKSQGSEYRAVIVVL
jgi:exodeoxyribonuclease V alpha subunit